MKPLNETQQRLLDVTPSDRWATITEISLREVDAGGVVPLSDSTIESHMRKLRRRGLVERRRLAQIVGPAADDFASGPPEFRRLP